MLTAIRGDQIKGNQIANYHVADSSNPFFGNGIAHEKLDLDDSIVASFLNSDESVHRAVLDSHLIALWDVALTQAVSGSSIDVTTIVNTTATSAQYQGVDADNNPETGNPKAIIGTTEKGVLLTGTGAAGAGTENYRVQIRDASSKDPIHDDLGGRVYGELTNNAVNSTSGSYTLSFKKSDGSDFTMAQAHEVQITALGNSILDNADDGNIENPASPTSFNSLDGKYFRISSPTTDYYVWYNVDASGNEPSAQNSGLTGIEVQIASSATASVVASTTASAIGALADFNANSSLAVITVTNTTNGAPLSVARDGAGSYETNFEFNVSQQGTPTTIDFMFLEVFSYLSAPPLSFTNGVGFADIVGVAGSHNHHDLYFTKIELESGQLDNRYYTKSQVDAGQLDNRYYTEAELDPNPGSDSGTAVLDTRYYRQTDLNTSTGPSGASKIGVSSITNLDASNVQSALAELQGDVDDILDGTANINHSLDRAYEDGSIVTVDSRSGNVDFQLEDTYQFKVSSDTGATDVLSVSAGAAGDSVAVAGDLSVVGDSTLTGVVSQSGGAVTINAGDAVDIDGTTVTIDGTSASSLKTTGANLNVQTVTSGTLTVSSAGELLVKDQALSNPLPLSQTGVTALSGNFDTATSIVGAINENADDLNTLITVTLPETSDGISGADQIGATGIEGIIPTGGNLGDAASVQAMLEGLAKAAGALKSYATEADFVSDKQSGSYLPVDTLVFIEDTNRFAIVTAESTSGTEGGDWDYIWGDARPMGGADFTVQSGDISFDTTGDLTIATDAGFAFTDDSGAQISVTSAGVVDVDAAAGQIVTIASDTEVEVNGGAEVNLIGDLVNLDGALEATGNADDSMIITTSGAGEVQLSSADEIDLTGGDIDINSGIGKVVTIDSDTSIATTAPVVDINGATSVDIDGAAINTTGALTQVGDMDLDGSIDHDGASFNSTVTGDFVANATGGVDVDGATVDLDAAGAHVGLTAAGQVDVDAAAGQLVDITSDTEVAIDGGALVDIDGTAVTIDGATTVTGAADDNFIVNTTGLGDVMLNSESTLDVNAPTSWFRGDVSVDSGFQLNVDKINITSVDPSDFATITGQRTGIPFNGNLLTNAGFETGSGADADNWSEGAFSGRTQLEKYYDNWSYSYTQVSEPGGVAPIATQALTGLNTVSHIASVWFKGTAQSEVQVVANGSTPAVLIPAGTVASNWTRFNVDVTPATADGDFIIQSNGVAGHNNNFFIDAVQLEEGTGAPTGYFSTTQSELILRIGDEAEDKISFQSQAPSGGTIQELMAIDNTTVRVFGDFIVDGSQTIINSTELAVDDNTITINKNMVGDPDVNMPGGTSEFIVERGDEANSVIRWNETTNKWELSNDGTNYYTILTSNNGEGTVNMDTAYDGGSSVTVDNTNVDFNLAAAKSFIISDGDVANASKFVVSSGSALDSIKMNTSGGVDIDATAGVVITGDTQVVGAMDFDGAIDHDGESFNSTVTGDFGVSSATITAAASGLADLDADSFDIDATTSVAVDSAAIAVTATGELDLAGDVVNIDGTTSVSVDAPAINTTGALTQTGNAQIVGNLDLDGNFDQSGNYTFLVDTSATAADAVRVNSAGGVDIDAASAVAINATDINTTGVLTQTGNAQIIGNMNFDGSIDHDGASFASDVSGAFDVTAGGAASITAEGLSLEAGAGAFTAQADAASTVNVTGAALNLTTTTSGNVALNAAGSVTFNDQFLTNPLPLYQAGNAAGLIDEFAYDSQSDFVWTTRVTDDPGASTYILPTSIVGAINANRSDLWEYVEIIATQGGDVSTAVGAGLIGVGGITGVVPSTADFLPSNGAVAGDPGNLQEILNGLAVSSGGGKVYASEAAFLTAKGGGTYFKTSEHVHILDTNRTIRVLTGEGNTATVQNVDWGYLYDSTNAIGDEEFFVNVSSGISLTASDVDVTATTFDVAASGAVLVDGESTVTLDAAGNLVLTSGAVLDVNAVTLDVDGTTLDIDMTGAVQINAAAASNVTVDGANLTVGTTTSGDVNISSAGNIVATATTADIDVTTFDVDATGAFTLDGGSSSTLNVNGGNLALTTSGSGEIQFYDARMPAAMPLTDAANSTFAFDPDGSAPASIYDAINRAYNNTGDTSRKTYWEAPALTSNQAALNYIQVSDTAGVTNYLSTANAANGGATGDDVYDLPAFGANTALTPLQLRRDHGVFLAIFLNGLRLSDSEWVYVYDHDNGRKIISFNQNHTTYDPNIDGDNDPGTSPFDLAWVGVNAVDAIPLSTQDHILFECTFQKYGNV
jgi:hypothetical protein